MIPRTSPRDHSRYQRHRRAADARPECGGDRLVRRTTSYIDLHDSSHRLRSSTDCVSFPRDVVDAILRRRSCWYLARILAVVFCHLIATLQISMPLSSPTAARRVDRSVNSMLRLLPSQFHAALHSRHAMSRILREWTSRSSIRGKTDKGAERQRILQDLLLSRKSPHFCLLDNVPAVSSTRGSAGPSETRIVIFRTEDHSGRRTLERPPCWPISCRLTSTGCVCSTAPRWPSLCSASHVCCVPRRRGTALRSLAYLCATAAAHPIT
ncbi:hypothetical protein ACQY74_000429 (plasmid) [Rhizobium leguminosarum bv. trifolii]